MARIKFKGVMVRQVFASPDGSYRICAVDTTDVRIKKNKYGNATIVGSMPELTEGVEYMIDAIEKEGKMGKQYEIKSCTRDIGTDLNSTRLFLNEILTPLQAEEIMNGCPNIIELVMQEREDEIDLSKLYNIKTERIKPIIRKIQDNYVFSALIAEFKGMFSFSAIKELHGRYNSVERVKQVLRDDPYGVMCDEMGYTFKVADRTLLDFEQEMEDSDISPIEFSEPLKSSCMRLESAMVYLLKENEYTGDTKMKTEDLRKATKSLTPQASHRFDEVIKNSTKFKIDKKYISRMVAYDTEVYIAKKLTDMAKADNLWSLNIDFDKQEFPLTDEQRSVLTNVANKNVSICNGPGGSGKSQSVVEIIKTLKDNGKIAVAVSPTGRAAKVLSAYTNHPASTIHRLLFQLQGDYINADIVIIDEISMPDIYLFKWLLENIDTRHTKILMIGDSAQIPSIGAGSILHSLLEAKTIPITTLTKIFRYGEGGIMTVATEIREGREYLDTKQPLQKFGTSSDYVFLQADTPKKILKSAIDVYTKLLQKYKPEDIAILSPFNVGSVGSNIINVSIQPIANPSSVNSTEFIEVNSINYYVGDMIMQTKNNYRSAVYRGSPDIQDYHIEDSYNFRVQEEFISNGDVGRVLKIVGKLMLIDFDGIKVVYGVEELFTCKHAYSMSYHKAQGSGFKVIVLITAPEHSRSMTSNLLYVGVTRAKERVYHIGDIDTINECIPKKEELTRLTYLKEILLDMNEKKEVVA